MLRHAITDLNDHLKVVAPHLAADNDDPLTTGYIKNAFDFLGIDYDLREIQPDSSITYALSKAERFINDLRSE